MKDSKEYVKNSDCKISKIPTRLVEEREYIEYEHSLLIVHEATLLSHSIENRVCEAYDFDIVDINTLPILIGFLESWARNRHIDLIIAKVPANDYLITSYLEDKGFRYVQSILHPKKQITPDIQFGHKGFAFRKPTAHEYSEVLRIAENGFTVSQFHNDSKISTGHANQWFRNRVEYGLLNSDEEVMVSCFHNQIAGFHLFQIKDRIADLFLTSVDTSSFWPGAGVDNFRAVFHYFQENDVRMIRTTISMNNMLANNVYSYFGFTFVHPEVYLHLWLN